jgi:hypothetical protein
MMPRKAAAIVAHHYYLGSPLEVLMLHSDGNTERVVVGPDLRNGQRVQLLIPGDTFHTAQLVGNAEWFLGASTEWPGVVPTDVEIGDVDLLAEKYPAVAADLRAIAGSAFGSDPRPSPAQMRADCRSDKPNL